MLGCILSQLLFNTYSEYIVREEDVGVKISATNIDNIRFSGDTTLFLISTRKKRLMTLLQTVNDLIVLRELLLNTKIMLINRWRTEFLLDGDWIEEVEDFAYLGSPFNSREIKRRLPIARSVTKQMGSV